MPYKGPYKRGYDNGFLTHWQVVQMIRRHLMQRHKISLEDFMQLMWDGKLNDEGYDVFGENVMTDMMWCERWTLDDIADTKENRNRDQPLVKRAHWGLYSRGVILPLDPTTYEDKGLTEVW